MMDIIIMFILLALGLLLLAKGADCLVEGAADLARYYKVSPIIVGLTVVAFGTSLPELFVCMMAAFNGGDALIFGNIIGSNIANIGLIVGISALIFPIAFKSSTVKREIPFLIFASVLFLRLAHGDYSFRSRTFSLNWLDGIILLLLFGTFLFYILKSLLSKKDSNLQEFKEEFKHKNPISKNIILIICGIIMLPIGGKLTVNSSTEIARLFGISEAFIGLTIVAIGTSLPELVTAIVAAAKKESGILVGNIVGSNIFNILLVLGFTSLIRTITVTAEMILFNSIVMIFFVLVLFLFAISHRKINRWEGGAFVCLYATYIVYISINM